MMTSKQNRSLSQSRVVMNFDLKTFRLSGVDVTHATLQRVRWTAPHLT